MRSFSNMLGCGTFVSGVCPYKVGATYMVSLRIATTASRAAAKAMDGDPAREKGKGQHRKDQFESFPGAENCLGNFADSPSKSGANEVGNHSDGLLHQRSRPFHYT